MNTLSSLQVLARLLRNLIRIGVITDVDTTRALCRVETDGITTDWLH